MRRDFLLDMFTACKQDEYGSGEHYLGQLVRKDGKIFGIDELGEEPSLIDFGKVKEGTPLLSFYEYIELEKGDLENVSSKIKTTVGRFLLNYLLLAYPFGDTFEYVNEDFSIGKIEDRIVRAGFDKTVTVEQIKTRYIPNIYFIGHFTELSVPSYSEKSISTSPKVAQRRKELMKQYKDQLDDPVIMSQIEDELIALDKEYLADDPSMGYFGGKGKWFDICRKKMLLTGGMVEDVNKESGYAFIQDPYDDGWDPDHFPEMVNDIRRGIYNRAVNTAKGGELVDFIRRIFQDSIISEDDCKTKRGLRVYLSPDIIDNYLHRNIITPSGLVKLTDTNKDKYVGKYVNMRCPMYCETKHGYCYTCMGDIMKDREVESLTMLTSKIGSIFMSISMAAMHGTKTKVVDISDVDQFVIQ